MRRTSIVVASLFLLGCAGGKELVNKSVSVEKGQSKQQVIDIMGAPGDRQFRGESEAWQYCRTGFSTDQFVVVWFSQGQVTGITTYKAGQNSGYMGDCSQGFKSVRWEDAPDQTIEVRQR